MKIHIYILSFLFVNAIMLSCRQETESTLPVYTVIRTDFEDYITVDGYVDPVQTTSVGCPSQVDGTVLWLAEDGTYVEEGDTICRLEDKNLDNEYNNALINLQNLEAAQNKSKADLAMQYALLDAEVRNNAAQTEIAKLDSLQLAYSTPSIKKIRELELAKAAIEKTKLDKKLNSLKIIQKSELRRQEIQITRVKNTINNSLQNLGKLNLVAPKSGMLIRSVHWITNNKIRTGDPVWEGIPIFIIPETEHMKVIINAREGEYKRIGINDLVEYEFDAMPENPAHGKILKKAPVGKPIKEKSKVKFFEIEASVDSSDMIPTPGLSARCNIILKRVQDTIVIPQIAVFEVDSMKVVYVKNKTGFEQRQISTGLSSPKLTVIRQGLKVKEEIALSKPDILLINKKTIFAKQEDKKKKSPPNE